MRRRRPANQERAIGRLAHDDVTRHANGALKHEGIVSGSVQARNTVRTIPRYRNLAGKSRTIGSGTDRASHLLLVQGHHRGRTAIPEPRPCAFGIRRRKCKISSGKPGTHYLQSWPRRPIRMVGGALDGVALMRRKNRDVAGQVAVVAFSVSHGRAGVAGALLVAAAGPPPLSAITAARAIP